MGAIGCRLLGFEDYAIPLVTIGAVALPVRDLVAAFAGDWIGFFLWIIATIEVLSIPHSVYPPNTIHFVREVYVWLGIYAVVKGTCGDPEARRFYFGAFTVAATLLSITLIRGAFAACGGLRDIGFSDCTPFRDTIPGFGGGPSGAAGTTLLALLPFVVLNVV